MSAIWNGPKKGRRKPNVERATSSISSGVAIPSSTQRTASQRRAICSRLATKPVLALTTAGALPSARRNDTSCSTTAGSLRGAATTSTPGVHSGGLNQCMPTNRSGRASGSARRSTGSDEVLVTMTTSSPTARSTSASTACLTAMSSATASSTKSALRARLSDRIAGAHVLHSVEQRRVDQAFVDGRPCARDHSLSGLSRQFGVGVGDANLQIAGSERLGDAAAHPPSTDDGDDPRPLRWIDQSHVMSRTHQHGA